MVLDVCIHRVFVVCFFFFKQKTAYEMRISDWSSDVCSSDLRKAERKSGDDKESGKIATGAKVLDIAMEEDGARTYGEFLAGRKTKRVRMPLGGAGYDFYPERRHLEHEFDCFWAAQRSEVHTAELQSLLRLSYAVFCLKKKNNSI